MLKISLFMVVLALYLPSVQWLFTMTKATGIALIYVPVAAYISYNNTVQ